MVAVAKIGLVLFAVVASACGATASESTGSQSLPLNCPCSTEAPELFSPNVFPSAPPMTPADETQAFSTPELQQLVSSRSASSDWRISLSVEDSHIATAVDLLMTTQLSEGFLSSLEGLGPSASIEFGDLPEFQAASVEVEESLITVNARYRFEHPVLLAAVLAHELVHHDEFNGRPEEAIALLVEIITLLELIHDEPQVLTSGTELARRQATNLLLAVFNSERLTEEAVVPGRVEAQSVYDALPYAQTSSPGLPLLEAFLTVLGIEADESTDFSREVVERVDTWQLMPAALDSNGIERLSNALRLKPIQR